MKKYNLEELKRLVIKYSKFTEAMKVVVSETKQLGEVWEGFLKASAKVIE